MTVLTLFAAGAAAVASPAVFANQAAGSHDHAPVPSQCAAATEADVNSLFQRFNDGFLTRDPDVMVPLFSRDAVLLPTVSGTMRTDAEGIRGYFVSFLRSAPVGTITESETWLGCNIATRVGNWSVQLTNPDSGETSTVSARFSFVYVYEDGAWKILHLHSSLRPSS